MTDHQEIYSAPKIDPTLYFDTKCEVVDGEADEYLLHFKFNAEGRVVIHDWFDNDEERMVCSGEPRVGRSKRIWYWQTLENLEHAKKRSAVESEALASLTDLSNHQILELEEHLSETEILYDCNKWPEATVHD